MNTVDYKVVKVRYELVYRVFKVFECYIKVGFLSVIIILELV